MIRHVLGIIVFIILVSLNAILLLDYIIRGLKCYLTTTQGYDIVKTSSEMSTK